MKMVAVVGELGTKRRNSIWPLEAAPHVGKIGKPRKARQFLVPTRLSHAITKTCVNDFPNFRSDTIHPSLEFRMAAQPGIYRGCGRFGK